MTPKPAKNTEPLADRDALAESAVAPLVIRVPETVRFEALDSATPTIANRDAFSVKVEEAARVTAMKLMRTPDTDSVVVEFSSADAPGIRALVLRAEEALNATDAWAAKSALTVKN